MYKTLFAALLIALSSVLCAWAYSNSAAAPPGSFPKALLVNQQPIHPNCVLWTQFGDSSRLDPKPIHHTPYESDCQTFGDEYLEIDLDANSVHWSQTFKPAFDDDTSTGWRHHHAVGYRAWHIDDDTCLVLVDHYSTDATGRFTELGLIKRDGDSLINGGEIACGDRAHGTVSVDFFKDGIVQFRTAATSASLMAMMKKELGIRISTGDMLRDDPLDFAGQLIWQCEICDGQPTPPQLIGIHFFAQDDTSSRGNI